MKPDAHLQTAATYPMTRAMDTHFADMDIGGHLNNVALARHFEDGRVALNYEASVDDTLDVLADHLEAHLEIDGMINGASD